MKKQTVFALLVVLVLALSACGTPPPATPTTPTLLPTQQTVIPTDITYPTFTPTPLVTSILYPTLKPIQTEPIQTEIPYPTASVVNANAVAFIAENALWVANVDGSGERRLTDIDDNIESTSNYLLKWSPNGKWISYISGNDLWVISLDGSVKRKVLLILRTDNKDKIWSCSWSPDSSKIAYIQTINKKLTSRLLDLETGDISELLVSTDQLSLSWSPDGRYIHLNTYTSLTIFEVVTGKVLKEINSVSNIQNDCPIWHGGVTWSPNSKWLYHLVSASGTYGLQICLSGLDGSSWQVSDIGGTISSPVWDKTGDYLYFVDGKMNLDIGANWFTNQRLVRYNVKTRKVEDLISLEEDGAIGHPPILSLSPNGQMLELYSFTYYENKSHYVDASRPKKNKFTILNLQSMSIVKFDFEFQGEIKPQIPPPAWSYDNQKIIFFLRNPIPQSYGIMYSDYGSFYSLDIKTGNVSLFSGMHTVENAVISAVATTP